MTSDKFEIATEEVLKMLNFNTTQKSYIYLTYAFYALNARYWDNMNQVYNHLGIKYNLKKKSLDSTVKRYLKSNLLNAPKDAIIEIFGYDINENPNNQYTDVGNFIFRVSAYINAKYK